MNEKPRPALFRVRVNLVDSNPEIWRLIEIDADLTLSQVHTALQAVMGWEDRHLHDFEDLDPHTRWKPGQPEPRRWGPAYLVEDDERLIPEEDFTLREVLTQSRPLFYEYDLGDRWLHSIILIETLPKTSTDHSVTVIRGERRCPLEDSGGIDGYEELLHAIADPAHENHHDQVEWVTEMHGNPGHPFDPAIFDKNATNRTLRKLFPRGPRG
ncbi:plasmid pRiA4b ORF-3 family protein [Subtercola vilae]|uniref:Plasmid pRiA4b ORF-3 family protein n=1 Tax=Subtercola vilae TaxID=2056433 RepID=A0A4T2BIM7_9MICO|nr:plasmid pRiA4b ORF-3 family protein [Subtercola vilae]TIH30800.1 plasmid pRiA4b ORF-3 family protein [Subtercola vilae]